MSAARSSLPSPHTLLSSAVPPPVVSSVSTAASLRSACVPSMSPTSAGAALHRTATAPARCGVAIDVPLKAAYPSPGSAERTFTPGAEMLGLTRPSSPAPRDEKEAMLPETSKAPTEYELVLAPGDDVVWQPGPALPEAQAPNTPAAAQAAVVSSYQSSMKPAAV